MWRDTGAEFDHSIPAPAAGPGLTSGGRCGSRAEAAAAAPSSGMLSAGAARPEMFSLRGRFDLELYVLVFTVLIPSWAATVKASSVSIISPP